MILSHYRYFLAGSRSHIPIGTEHLPSVVAAICKSQSRQWDRLNGQIYLAIDRHRGANLNLLLIKKTA
jgi:hypothetical protein